MLQLGLGDIATRIVRGLRTRGRMPITMDETMVPVASVIDLTDSLFAQNPATWGFYTVQSFAAQPGRVLFQNRSALLTEKIDHIQIINAGATAISYLIVLYRSQANITLATALNGVITNQPSPQNTTTPAQITCSFNNQAGLAGVNSYTLGNPALAPNQIWEFDANVVLYAGDAIEIAGPGVANTMAISVTGREFLAG